MKLATGIRFAHGDGNSCSQGVTQSSVSLFAEEKSYQEMLKSLGKEGSFVEAK